MVTLARSYRLLSGIAGDGKLDKSIIRQSRPHSTLRRFGWSGIKLPASIYAFSRRVKYACSSLEFTKHARSMVAHANPGAMVVCSRDLGLSAHLLVMVDDAFSLWPVGMAVALLNVWPLAAALTSSVARRSPHCPTSYIPCSRRRAAALGSFTTVHAPSVSKSVARVSAV